MDGVLLNGRVAATAGYVWASGCAFTKDGAWTGDHEYANERPDASEFLPKRKGLPEEDGRCQASGQRTQKCDGSCIAERQCCEGQVEKERREEAKDAASDEKKAHTRWTKEDVWGTEEEHGGCCAEPDDEAFHKDDFNGGDGRVVGPFVGSVCAVSFVQEGDEEIHDGEAQLSEGDKQQTQIGSRTSSDVCCLHSVSHRGALWTELLLYRGETCASGEGVIGGLARLTGETTAEG